MSDRLNRIIRERDLVQFCGVKRTTINLLIRKGKFPAPIRLSDTGRAKGWLEAELLEWQAWRVAQRDGGNK